MNSKEETLSEEFVNPDPFMQFDKWYKEHLSAGVMIPEVVYLGTASSEGIVSVRTVLLKDYSDTGFTFFTNYRSKKGLHLASNRNIALLFYWPESNRQVRIEGVAEKTSPEISDLYFNTRPRESQLAAWASEQSSGIAGREYLEERFSHYQEEFSGSPVKRPDYWGGYIITPDWFEFWQDRERRLHDRIIYTRKNNKWLIARLAP